MLTTEEWKGVEEYDRWTAAQMDAIRQADVVEDIRPENQLAAHLDVMIRHHREEIAFQGAEIGMLNRLKTTFRKDNHIVQLCDFHIRICNAIMEDASRDAERIRAEKKSCRV